MSACAIESSPLLDRIACVAHRLAVPACAGLQSFPARRATRSVVARASLDTNLFVNLILSGACGAAATAVTVYTSENRDAEIQRIQTVEGALPVAGALFLDAAMHSVPGLNALFQLLGAFDRPRTGPLRRSSCAWVSIATPLPPPPSRS